MAQNDTSTGGKYKIDRDWLVLLMAAMLGFSSAFYAGAVGWDQIDTLTPTAIDLAKALSLLSGPIFAWVTYAALHRDNSITDN